jgi:hypothetical protein
MHKEACTGDADREEQIVHPTHSPLAAQTPSHHHHDHSDEDAEQLAVPSTVATTTGSSTSETAVANTAAIRETPTTTKDSDEDELTVTKSLHVRRDWYSTIATFVAGGVAGAASRTLTAPLDRIKLIVQEGHLVQASAGVKASADAAAVASHRSHPSLLQVARLIKADGGWKAFWRGNVINCFKAGPEFAIVFSIRRYVSSLYEDCVEREKRRRKRSVARWKERDERSFAIARREEEERDSMLGTSTQQSHQAVEKYGSSGSGVSGSTGRNESNDTSTEHSLSSSSSGHSSAAAPVTPDWHYLSPQELRERERVVSAEASIFTPPFNRLGCLSSIPHLAINCTIGAIAGLGAQGVLYPLEVVKTRVVVSRSNEYRGGVREIVRLGYKKGGIMEFYRGFAPNMVGIVVYRGLEMGLYSTAQQSIMLYRMQVLKMNRHDAGLSAAEVGVVGMFASTVAQTVSYPLNVIRTRLQTQGTNGRAKKYSGMVDCCIKMIRYKGVTSLFSGLTANYLKAVPASACTFVVFEWAQRLLVGDD